MKSIVTTGLILVAFAAGDVVAQAPSACPPAGILRGAQMVTLLSGRYVCASRGADSWKEKHIETGTTSGTSSGDIEDYKLGTDPMDPTKVVGTYVITIGQRFDTITYNYGSPAVTYRYVLKPIGGQASAQYQFCNVVTGELINANVQTPHC